MVRANRSLLNLQSGTAVVIGDSNRTGVIAEVLDDHAVLIRIGEELRDPQAKHIRVSANQLRRLPDGRLHLPLDADQLQRLEGREGETDDSGRMVVPVAEERLQVGRRTVETGRVIVDKTVHEHEETVDEPVITEEAHVRRVPVNRMIDHPVEIREEGDELVVPLMEEVLVVEKRLMLREELRISRTRSEKRDPASYTLRREEANVRRTEEHSTPTGHQDKDSHNG